MPGREPPREPAFPAWVYGLVLLTAACIALLLWWFTAHYNMPLEVP